MGALTDLYRSIEKELGKSQVLSSASESDFAEKLRRETIRHYISQELFDLELSLLLDDQQKGALFLSHREDKDAPLDELELIVRNKVSVNHYIGKAKKCILDLDELSTTDNEAETTELHRDEFSGKVLNMLQKQMVKVMLLNDGGDNEQAEWFIKKPKEFIREVLIGNDRNGDAFGDVRFEEDLSVAALDCRDYLRKSHPKDRWNTIRAEDAAFNKDAAELLKNIRAWEEGMKCAKGKEYEELKRKKQRAENILAKATNIRNSAIRDAFRSGDISEYYYRQRSEQLDRRDYSRVPEMFEVDALKDKDQYLRNHDLQDLSLDEQNAICDLALKRAEKEKEIYLKKEYLTKRGLSRSRRYLISEMSINKDIFYRGLAARSGLYKDTTEEDEARRISVDIDDPGEDYIGMTMRQVPSPGDRERSLKK